MLLKIQRLDAVFFEINIFQYVCFCYRTPAKMMIVVQRECVSSAVMWRPAFTTVCPLAKLAKLFSNEPSKVRNSIQPDDNAVFN